ncbi:porin [Grimontia hollisae]|uniref:Outer membrane protein OmpU n=1 Tax=Grimontia hollisae CIP 101886 TaxID=675812 RepID=D0I801_GRIHO|nr:porin [Grimontia hollisae]AMG31099.1 porin [Grimontia hollisae]EEY72770.1 outer membrane protein OmpU [Grimontia hollisae CIP 101886]MDF2185203.1 porin [Grimontia hollisae]STO46615.1 Outer membrane porin protein OmpD precursor [Grimontia hollisae]STQ76874.1 Outer membrane porin protein OmpD precursor [Grimontia hollisae]
MNKKLIALAVAAVASTSVSAAEIFNDGTSSLAIGGRAEARAAIKDGDVNDNSRVRLNVMGTTQIAEGAYGIGFFEQEFTTNDAVPDGEKDETRYLFAGIGSDYGLVTYGKNDGSLGVITDFTDIMAYHGNGAGAKIAVADRTDNNLGYMGEFGGLTVKANYVFDTVSEGINNTVRTDRVGGYSASAIYNFDFGLALGLGYADQGKNDIDAESQAMAAASYTVGDFYFAGLFADGEFGQGVYHTETAGFELAAAYTMNQTKFTATYNYQEAEMAGIKYDTVDQIAIDATHFFNDNFRAYASYNFNLLDEKDVAHKLDAEDELVFGLRYDF